MMIFPFLCRLTRQCHGIAWSSSLRRRLVFSTKERAQAPLTASLAPWRCCHSASLIPFPRNYWLTWLKVECQTCALSVPTCSDCQGQVSPTTLQDQRLQCENEFRISDYANESHGLNRTVNPTMCDQELHLKHQGFLDKPVHHVHFLGCTWMDNPLDILAQMAFSCFGCIFFQCRPCLTFSKKQLRKTNDEQGSTCDHISRVHFNMSTDCLLSSSCLFSWSCLFLHFLFVRLVQHVLWPSKAQLVAAQPFSCACACVSVCMYLVCCWMFVWHTSALQVTTQQQSRSQRRKVWN